MIFTIVPFGLMMGTVTMRLTLMSGISMKTNSLAWKTHLMKKALPKRTHHYTRIIPLSLVCIYFAVFFQRP